MLAPFLPKEEKEVEVLDQIISRMRETKINPGLKRICENDKLAREFGVYNVGRLGPVEQQRLKDQDNVSTKMRTLARLVIKLNEGALFEKPLSFYICSKEFKHVAKAVKDLYQGANSSQLGISLGNYVKQCSFLKISMAMEQEDFRMKREGDEFKEHFDAKWKSLVSSVANRSKRLNAMNKRNEMPITEDLVKVKDFLVDEIKKQMELMIPTYAEYVYMTHMLIARITLFNKRRVSEVAELKKTDFFERVKGNELDTNLEIYNSLDTSERTLLKRMELIEVRGKSTRGLRKVFVILDKSMVEGLQHLLVVRSQCGIDSQNRFLFARTTDTPQDGCEALRVVTAACRGLIFLERIRTTKLRKYLATTSQIMDMRDDELKLIADHMGHSVAIHTEVYRMQTSLLERTKVARALLALEDGKLQQFNGRSLSSVSLDELPELEPEPEKAASFEELPVPEELDNSYEDVAEVETEAVQELPVCTGSKHVSGSKKRWSKEEEHAFREAFDIHIKRKKNVSTADIRKAQECYPVLQGRSEAVIRTKINNIKLGKNKNWN